jgi:hypothetical protein
MILNTKVFIYKVVATYSDDGFWTVIGDMVGGDDLGFDHIETRTLNAKSIDKDLTRAMETVDKSLQARFQELNGDLLSIPKEEDGHYFPSPIEHNKTT